MASMCLSIGLVLSWNFADKEPLSIFSNPRANTQSAIPPSMSCFPKYNAVLMNYFLVKK